MIQKNCDYLVILSFGSIDVFSTIIYYLSFLVFPWQIDLFFFLFNPYTIDLVADTTRGNEEKNKTAKEKFEFYIFYCFGFQKFYRHIVLSGSIEGRLLFSGLYICEGSKVQLSFLFFPLLFSAMKPDFFSFIGLIKQSMNIFAVGAFCWTNI